MADQEIQLVPPAEVKGGRLKLVLIASAVATTLLAVGGAGAYFAGVLPGTSGESGSEEAAKEIKREALYIAIDPPFTVNLQGGDKSTRYFQTTVELLTRDPEAEALVKRHLPVIRDNLVMLFSSKEVKELTTAEGKDRLRGEALAAIQKVLETETGNAPIEQVFFTSFVMQ